MFNLFKTILIVLGMWLVITVFVTFLISKFLRFEIRENKLIKKGKKMNNRMLNVSSVMTIDHSKEAVGEALGANYDAARKIALSTIKHQKASEAIEDMIFNHNVPIQTRFLAVFIAGVMRGQIQGPGAKIIIHKPKEDRQ